MAQGNRNNKVVETEKDDYITASGLEVSYILYMSGSATATSALCDSLSRTCIFDLRSLSLEVCVVCLCFEVIWGGMYELQSDKLYFSILLISTLPSN